MAGAVYVTGDVGSRVAVYKRGRRYYLRAWHRGKNQPRYKACRTSDFEVAKSQARALARRLEDGDLSRGVHGYTLSRIFASYGHLRTPQKVSRYQSEDRRRTEMWKAYLGSVTRPEQITLMDWERFQEDRRTGKIDARGERRAAVVASMRQAGPETARNAQQGASGQGCDLDVSDHVLNGSRLGMSADRPQRPVRPRVIRGDLMWLRTVLRWAKAHGMIDSNPTDDWPLPSDPNPRRNMATEERLEAILKVVKGAGRNALGAYERVGTGPGKPLPPFGYLYELLTLCAETGRRIGAVRMLRYSDLRLKAGPHGSIAWPAKTDKARRDSLVPLSSAARSALDLILHERPGIGDAPLFPHPKNPTEPVSHWYCRRWMEAAEKAAGLPHLGGTLFHAYRRKWATERKHLPVMDVAAAGGWTGPDTLQRIYQQPDASTLYRVVSEPSRIKEAQ